MTLEVVREVVQGINSFSGSDANKSSTFRLAYKIVSRNSSNIVIVVVMKHFLEQRHLFTQFYK